MEPFILFCKSFRDDVLRVEKLLSSVVQFNEDHLPFYLSIPEKDLGIFKEKIDFTKFRENYPGKIEVITDESIVAQMPNSSLLNYYGTKGYIGQQVIKAQVWRLLNCENYLSLDSDSYFTKPFNIKNFIHSSGVPFTILHDGSELIELSEKLGYPKVKEFFLKDNALMKREFERDGVNYDFGPAPLIWSAKVWDQLDQHLTSQSETIWEAFNRIPSEIRWYGETLLKYQPIAIYPIKPIFDCYHYDWQAAYYKKHPELKKTRDSTIGEVVQSYWDESLRPRFAKKPWYSRAWKTIRKIIRKQ
jgi:hypothetical protein